MTIQYVDTFIDIDKKDIEKITEDPLKSYDLPFSVKRREHSDKIFIFGYHLNWSYSKQDKQWYKLAGNDWVKCDIPEYERIYNELNLVKSRKRKLKKL
jgi:hypothetical protein